MCQRPKFLSFGTKCEKGQGLSLLTNRDGSHVKKLEALSLYLYLSSRPMISYGRTAYREANLFDFCHPHWVFSLQLNETKWVQVEVISERSLIVLSKSNRICSTQWTDGQEKREKFQVHTCSLDCLVLWEKKPVAQNGIINRHDHNWESAHIVTCFGLSHPYWLLMSKVASKAKAQIVVCFILSLMFHSSHFVAFVDSSRQSCTNTPCGSGSGCARSEIHGFL